MRRWLLALCGVITLLAAGCGAADGPATDGVQDVVERGPLRLAVTARPAQVKVGDPVTVQLTVETPPEYQVAFPAPDAFGELAARVTAEPEPRLAADRMIWQRRFEIVPLAGGAVEIPALTVEYERPAANAETQPTRAALISGPLTVEAVSLLAADDEPTRPRDITGTLLPPPPPMSPRAMLLVLGGLGAALLLILLVAWRLYRWMMTDPPPTPPEVRALRALEELAQEEWYAPDQVRAGYYRLTEIVRTYIERKFALAAPEMTTEEFLARLARDRGALPYDAERLREFLQACDMVKYAGVNPTREEAEGVLATARAFVHATAAATERAARQAPNDDTTPPARPPGSSVATYCVQPAGGNEREGGDA